jgi:hypothetical protein
VKPTVARTVHYTLSAADADAINSRRADADAFRRKLREDGGTPAPQAGERGRTGHVEHVGNAAREGDVCAAVVVRVFHPSVSTANLQVQLDGSDHYWATSRMEGDGPGYWQWPPRA